jgi:hypothetical protein
MSDSTAAARIDASLDRLIELGLATPYSILPAKAADIAEAERRYGPLPLAYRRYLERAGRGIGRLHACTDLQEQWWLLHIRDSFDTMTSADGSPLIRPSDIVIGDHQGYIVQILVGDSDDPAVAELKEDESGSITIGASFTGYLAELVESTAEAERRRVKWERENGVRHPRNDITIYPAQGTGWRRALRRAIWRLRA